MHRILIPFLLVSLVAWLPPSCAFAQGTKWQPSVAPELKLNQVAAARAYKNSSGEQVVGLVLYEPEIQNYTVQVPYTENVTQQYQVNVPYTENVSEQVTDPKTGETKTITKPVTKTRLETKTRTVAVQKMRTETRSRAKHTFRGRRRIEVPIDDVKIWTAAGRLLVNENAIQTLRKTKRCFLINSTDEYKGEPFFTEMFRDDVIVISYDKAKYRNMRLETKSQGQDSEKENSTSGVLEKNSATTAIDFANPDHNLINREIVRETNARRSAQNLSPLTFSPRLTVAARSHSKNMASQKFFSHENPYATASKTMVLRVTQSGYKYTSLAENIAQSFGVQFSKRTRAGKFAPHTSRTLAKELLDMWMKSPGHRKNILSDNTELGVGVAFYRDGTANNAWQVKSTQVFGTPVVATKKLTADSRSDIVSSE